MVDASVGGKTGVDLPSGKNLVGAFHPPRFVLADTDLTSTLPRAERSQGLAEAVKHGAILDADYFRSIVEEADSLLGGAPLATAGVVARSVELKASVVSQDEKEVGLRQILNFGHTLGHALEAASQYRLPHGNAVAIGMVLEARLGERMGVTRSGVADEIAAAVGRIGLSGDLTEAVDTERLLALVSRDKKVREGVARYVLLRDVGTVDPGIGWSHTAAPELVREVLLEAAPEAL
jgi:3-dehydroquinate synthase